MDRRTPLVLLAALLTSGCVAVPPSSAPGPSPRGGEVAPAAVRTPSPLPAWPVPREAAPRETLAATEPKPGPKPAPSSARPRARGWEPPRIPPRPPGAAKPPTRRKESVRTPGPRKPPHTETPHGMRSLCRQAAGSGAVPAGILELCRSTYGR
ncbi:hypothetical protein ACIPPS_08990 [Streptomyces sp. NPDC090127]|uniref:hypothetical protein n=1 Tax=Streptomyces sp. NPDC090127 TaxID=3365953 RepID=UPI00382FB750